MTPTLTFDPTPHIYRIGGQVVPSVTEALGGIVPQWKASEWYLQRGTAVHACAALIMRDQLQSWDPQITGQVVACQAWKRDFSPRVLHVETQVYSLAYRFAGTIDLAADIGGRLVLCDWKSTLTRSVQWQLGAYAIGMKETHGTTFREGFGIELRDHGAYQVGETYDLTRAGREFLAILGAYNCMKRERVI